jgi:hypothetical protein
MNKSCIVCGAVFSTNHNLKLTCSATCSKLRKKNYEANKWKDAGFRLGRQTYMSQYIKRPEVKEKEHSFRKVRNARSEVRAQKAEYKRNRYFHDINFKLTNVLRARLNGAILNNHKGGSAVEDLGCSIEELKKHLELQWKPGMTWDNWTTDGWHIDHIKPLSKFDLTNPTQCKEACHYTNLQPLWSEDNLRKGDKLSE